MTAHDPHMEFAVLRELAAGPLNRHQLRDRLASPTGTGWLDDLLDGMHADGRIVVVGREDGWACAFALPEGGAR